MIKENQLLNRIIKAVTGKEAVPELVAAPVEVVEAAVVETVEVITLVADESGAQAELSVMRSTIEANVVALAEMTAKFESAHAALDALIAEKAALAVKAAEAKFAARKDKVVLAIGTEKADGLMLATQGLDDASFDAVVNALAGAVDVEASKGLFTEVGVSATADTTKIVAESPEMKILKQKFKGAK